MKKLFLFLVIAVFFFIFLDAFAYYSFLFPESNDALENLKEKYRAIEVGPVGGPTQGPFYTTESGVAYEYYLGYVPSLIIPETGQVISGGWAVSYAKPIKEKGIVWTVIIPKNSGVETNEVKEAVYNDENGVIEGIYTFTDIIIKNPQGWTSIIWGSAAKAYPYDVPRLCFVFDS